jgi:hypothetical protein
MNHPPQDRNQEFGPEIRLLRDSLPELSELELDRIKRRVKARGRPRGTGVWHLLRARAAVIGVIAVGALMTAGGGAALAVSGASTSGSASTAQYGTPTGPTVTAPTTAVTPAQQVAQTPVSTSSRLPFTGYAAIGVVALGLVLLVTGLGIRFVATRKTTGSPPPS